MGDEAVDETPVHSFYRVAKRYPPGDREYLTPQDKFGDPPDHETPERMASWDGLSAYDTEDGARRAGRQFTHLGNVIVRYDIPEGAGITWTPSMAPGHVDLRGDKEALKGFLTDIVATV